MNYLLDTCVLSVFTSRIPDKKVIDWLAGIDENKLYLSVITVGEIERGIERLIDSHRKTELSGWMNSALIDRFSARILPLDSQTMLRWGSLVAHLDNSGSTMPLMDSLISATALQHNLIIATRNTSDFLRAGTPLINPWE